MVSLSASIDGAACKAFDAAFREFAASLGDGVATAPRRAAISMCKSFRAATRVAKKNKGMSAAVSAEPPQWITYKDGRRLDRPLRRWSVTLTDRGKTFVIYVHAGSRSEMKRQVRELVGTNYYPEGAKGSPQKRVGVRGLAKQSWGWVMHNIFSGAAPDEPWRRRKRDVRDPRSATFGSYSKENRGASLSSGEARISNRIDYIVSALRISTDEVISKAANKLIRPILNARMKAGGMSPSEIKAAGHKAHEDWLRQFSD